MAQSASQGQNDPGSKSKLQLYIYGSCQSDQYYHPTQQSQSKRPICLSEIQKFEIEAEGEEPEGEDKIIVNPLFRAQIFKIACGALHTIVLTSDGQAFSFGCNDEGALGREGIQKIPQLVNLPVTIDLISAGDNHSVFANSYMGSVFFTGSYKYMRGESIGNRTSAPERTEVGDLDSRMRNVRISKVVSGSNHSAILVGGKVFIRGEPQAHTVGRRINERHKVKNCLTYDSVGLNHVQDLWCGGYHSFAKVKKGDNWLYYAWGLNKHGQLGLGNYNQSSYPQQIKKLKGKRIIEVAAGTNFTVFLTQQGQIYGCGQNDDGQLGLGEDYVFEDSDPEQQSEEAEKQEKVQKSEKKEDQKKEQKHEEKKEANLTVEKSSLPANQQQKSQLKEAPVHAQKEAPKQAENKKEENLSQPHQVKRGEIPQEESPVHKVKEKLQQKNIYIKSFRRVPIEQKLQHIAAGSNICFGWNEQSLYSWGFGSNFVLLNGREEDQYRPFKVRSKIINQHTIYDLAPGAQHVAYLSYPSKQAKPHPKFSQTALKSSQEPRKLSRRKKV